MDTAVPTGTLRRAGSAGAVHIIVTALAGVVFLLLSGMLVHVLWAPIGAGLDQIGDAAEAWIPAGFTPEQLVLFDEFYLDAYARMKPGVTILPSWPT